MSASRIVILEPDERLRETLRELLASEPDLRAIAVQEPATNALGAADVVLVDERIAGATSAATRATLAALRERALVVVMGLGEPLYYEHAHVEAGAVGYWPKDGDVERLIGLVRAAGLVAQIDRASVAERRRRRRAHPGERLTVA